MSLKVSTFTAVSTFALALSAMFAGSDAHAQCASTTYTISRAEWVAGDSDADPSNGITPSLGAYTTSKAQAASSASQLFLINATDFTPAELNTVIVTYEALFLGNLGGVIGTYSVTNAWTVNLMESYLSATCDSATVSVNASLMTSVDKINKIAAYISKIDSVTNLPAAATLNITNASSITGTINGSGTVAITGATLASSVNLGTNVGSGVTLSLPAPYTVNSSVTLTLTAAQATGREIAGAGTVAISSTTLSAGTYDFDGITTSSTTMTATAGTGVVLQLTAAQSGTMTVNPDGANFASATITGTANADTVPAVGINAIRTISGLASADSLNGSGQADSINGGAGNDTIVGGAGVDTAVYSGDIGTISGTSTLTVGSSNSTADGSDTVSGVEILDFANGDVRVINAGGSSYTSLASFISNNPSNTDKLYGALEIDSTTFANSPNSAASLASLNALLGRMVSGSVVTVNVIGMNSNQLTALATTPAPAGLPVINYPPVRLSTGSQVQGYYTTIQAAINAASAGDTVTVAPGTYTERLTIAKRITLDGAGKGSDPAANTIIASAGSTEANVVITGSGLSSTDRLVLKDLRVSGNLGSQNAGSGIRIRAAADTTIAHLTFDNVSSSGNTGYGMLLEGTQVSATPGTGALNDIVMTGCEFSENNIGVRVAGSANLLDGFTITGCTFSANKVFGLQTNTVPYDVDHTNFVINGNTVFNGNGTDGYLNGRYGDISILGFNGNLTMNGVTVNGITGASPANLGISISGWSSATDAPVAAGTMSFSNVTITGKFAHPSNASYNPGGQGRAFGIKSYASVSNVSFSNVSINNTYGNSLELFGISGTMNLAGISFGVPTTDANGTGTAPRALSAGGSNDGTRTAYSIVTGVGSDLATGKCPVNAAGATFVGIDTSADAGRFSAQARLLDAIDGTDRGLVTLLANNVYVPSGGSVANGLAAASANNNTVNFDGVAYTGGPFSVGTPNLTLNAAAGASGLSFTLGATDSVSLAGAGNINVTGNNGPNTVSGNGGVNTLAGGNGADSLSGGAGADVINGGNDNDTLTGGAGADTVNGDAGNDTFVIASADGDDTLSDGGADIDTMQLPGSRADWTFASVPDSNNATVANSSLTMSQTVTAIEVFTFGSDRVLLVGGGSSYSTLGLAAAASASGDHIRVLGTNVNPSLTAAIPAGVTVYGSFAVTSASFPNGATSAAVFASFVNSIGTGATYSVDMRNMNATQIAAVNAVYAQAAASITAAYAPVTISRMIGGPADPTAVGQAPTIQTGIDYATAGDTVEIAAGTYTANVSVGKRITLMGAGSGSDATANTIITAAAAGTSTIVYSVGGTDATSRQVLKNVRVTGASGGTGNNNSGILLSGGSMGYFTFDNVTATGNSGHGLVSNVAPATATLTDVVIANSTFASNGSIGVRTASHSVNGFSITNCAFTSNTALGLAFNTDDNQSINLGGISLSGVTFSGNSSVADLYASGLCPSNPPTGPDGSMSLTNVDFLGSNGSGGVGLYLVGKNLDQVASPAIGTVTLNDVTVTGTYTNSAIAFLGYSNLAGVSMTDVVLSTSVPTADRAHLRLRGVGGTLDIGNTSFVAPSSNVPTFDISLTSGATGSVATVQVDATDAIFGGVAANVLSSAQLFAVEDRVRHALDNTTNAPGFVRVKAGNVYVTANSGSVQRGVNAASTNDVVNVAAANFTTEVVTLNKVVTVNGAQPATGDLGYSLTLGTADSVTLAGDALINVTGNANANTVSGNDGINTLAGGDQNDTLSGGAGADIVNGEAGDDTVNGNAGNDTLNGSDGNDTASGGAGADVINGGADADTLSGGDDNDTMNGDAGNDALNGDAGTDSLNGGDGNDTLTGGADADTLNGGSGTDTAAFAAAQSAITVVDSSTISVDGDSITEVELVQFTDATVAIVGRGGSSISTLNAALAAYPAPSTVKFWGTLLVDKDTFTTAAQLGAITARFVQGNSSITVNATGMSSDQRAAVAQYAGDFASASNLALTSADSAANIAILLSESVANNATVDMAGMSPAQIASVNGGLTKVASVANYTVRVYEDNAVVQYDLFVETRTGFESYPGAVARANALKLASPLKAYKVLVNAGQFELDNVLVLNGVTLQGAGRSQTDAAQLTRLRAPNATPPTINAIVSVTGDNSAVRDIQLEGQIVSGTSVARGISIDSSESNAVVNGLTVNNVLCSLNQYGFAVLNGESAAGVTITNSVFAANGNGLAIEHMGSVVGFTMNGGEVTGNTYGFGVNAQNTVGYDNAGTFTNVSISGTTVSGNSQKGFYFEKINNATFSNLTFTGNAGAAMTAPQFPPAALEFNLKFDDFSGITVTNCTFSDNGGNRPLDGAAIVVAARNDGATYSANPATLATVAISGGRITGSPANIKISNDVDLETVSISGTSLEGLGAGIVVAGVDAGEVLTLGNVRFNSTLTYSVFQAKAGATVNAAAALFASGEDLEDYVAGSALPLADAFATADKIVDSVDAPVYGKVVLQSGKVFVTPASFFNPTTTPSIARAIGTASTSDTVHVKTGTYPDGAVTVGVESLTVDVPVGATGFSLSLGSANNISLSGSGAMNVSGNLAANAIVGNEGVNTLAGSDDADTLSGAGGADTINGGAGNDTMNGGNDADSMNGDAGADTMNGGADADAMSGGDGNDTVNGDAGIDSLNGDAGDDTLSGGADGDTLNGGSGTDTAVMGELLGTIAEGTSPYITAGGDSLTQVEILDFTDVDVVIVGRGGSSFASLDAALSSTASAGKKFWGNLVITKDSFDTAAELNALLARFVTDGSSVTVNATGMNTTERAAVAQYNGSIASATNLALDSTDSAADIATLLTESTGNATVNMAGMNPDQIFSVNGNLLGVASVTNFKVRIFLGTNVNPMQYDLYLDTRTGYPTRPGAVERANALENANPLNSYTVRMEAGTFNLDGRIELNRIALVGAGSGTLVANSNAALPPTISGGSIIDMSNSPVDGTFYPQGILALGDGVVMRDFALTSPTRSSGKGDRYGIKSAGPQGNPALTTTNLTIDNVRVHDVAMSAFDFNTLVGGTVSNTVASYASAGYGFAFSGGSRNTALSNITVLNCAWGDVGVFPWRPSAEGGPAAGTADHTPSGISFSGTLGITSINCQPYNSTIAVSSGAAGDSGYNAAAQVLVPAEFNRIASSVRTRVSNGSTLAMNQVCRQKDLAAVLTSYTSSAQWSFSTPVVTNNLGLFEVVSVSGGVRTATAGRTSLDAALAAASAGNEINVWGPSSVPAGTTNSQATPAVSLADEISINVTITGDVPLTNSSFASVAILNSLVGKVAASANLSVDLTSMVDAKLNGVSALKSSFDSIGEPGQIWAVNYAGSEGIVAALNLGNVSLVGYEALPEVTGFLYQSAAKTDMTAVENPRAFANVAAAGTQWAKYVDFRTTAYAMLTGAALASADFSSGGRFVAVEAARVALDGKTLFGETVTATQLGTTITKFNGYAASGKAYLLASMNGARTSVTDVNAAASGINLDKARAADTIAAGINSSTSAPDIQNALFYQNDVAAYVTGGLTGGLITSVNAGTGQTAMSSAQINALAAGAANLAANSVTGDVNIDSSIGADNLAAFLPKVSVGAFVTINASDMSGPFFTAILANASKVDSITNLTLTSAVAAADISTLLGKASNAIVIATGMGYTVGNDQINAVAAKTVNIATDGIRGSVSVTSALVSTNLDAFLGKCSQLPTTSGSLVTVTATGMEASFSVLVSKIANIDVINSLVLTNAQSDGDITTLLTKAVNARAIATDMNQTKLSALAAGFATLDADGVTGTMALDTTVTGVSALLGKTSAADATVNVDATSTFTGETAAASYIAFKAALSSNILKVDTIVDLALADSEDAPAIGSLLGKTALLGATVDANGMEAAQFNAIGFAIGTIADDGISGTFTIDNGVNYVGAVLGKTQVAATVTVDAQGMNSTKLDQVAANSNKVDFLINVTVTASADISLAELQTLFDEAGANSVFVIATGMNSDYLNVVALNAGKVIANGITGDVAITSAIVDANLGALLAKTSSAANVSIDASDMTSIELSAIAANIGVVDEIYDLTLTSAQVVNASATPAIDEITALLSKSVASASVSPAKAMAVATATGMSAAQINALAGSAAKLANDGITGTLVLVNTVTDANMVILLGGTPAKVAESASVEFNGTSMTDTQLGYAVTYASLVDTTYNLSLTSTQTAAQIASLLSRGIGAATTGKALAVANATGMSSSLNDQLAKLADNYLKIRAVPVGGISGDIRINSGLTSTQITNLVSRVFMGSGFTGGTTVVINAAGMTDAQLSSVASSVTTLGNSILDITSITLTANQSSTELALLISATNSGQATVVATGMDSNDLNALGTNSAALGTVTGTVVIDVNVNSTAIAALMNTSVSSGATVTIDPTGFNTQQQAAYSTALTTQALFLVSAQTVGGATEAFVKAGETVRILVSAKNLPLSGPSAVAAQGRINYDSSRLTFVSAAGGAAMPTLLSSSTGSTGGVPHVTFYTGISIVPGSQGIYDGVVAELTFTATTDGFCKASDLASLNTSFTNRLVAGSQAVIPAIGTSTMEVSALKNLALANVPAGTADASDSVDNISYYTDAFSTTGAIVTNPGVTASNNCGAVTVTISIAYPNSTTGTVWPAEFPIGTSRVTWTSTDSAGNTTNARRDIVVINKHLMTVDVDLAPTISAAGPFTLPIRFRLSSGTAVTADVSFSATGNGTVRDVEIPVLANYTCITAKDPINTLADAQTMSVSGTKWVCSGSFSLVAGDSTDDNVKDIFDFAAFVTDRGVGKNELSRSNFNRDTQVNNADFGFISLNFLAVGDNCNGGFFNGGARDRVSVKELRRMGLGHMEEADIDGDGWVDTNDIALAAQGQYRRPIEGLDEPTELEQPNW